MRTRTLARTIIIAALALILVVGVVSIVSPGSIGTPNPLVLIALLFGGVK